MPKLVIVASSSVVMLALALFQDTAAITNSISLAGAIATIIAALFVGIVNVIAARSAAKNAIRPVIEKVDKIEAHVNSEKTRDQGTIATQKSEIDLLREMNSELKKMAALLAQAQSTRDLTQAVAQAASAGATAPVALHPPIVVAPVAVPTAPVASVASVALVAPVDDVLKAIEKNTEETAINTKKTDDTVQELKDKS